MEIVPQADGNRDRLGRVMILRPRQRDDPYWWPLMDRELMNAAGVKHWPVTAGGVRSDG
jgi:hypothetical protein